jgi:hypothetical protein
MFALSSAHFHLVDSLYMLITFLLVILSHPELKFFHKNETNRSTMMFDQVRTKTLIKKDFKEREVSFVEVKISFHVMHRKGRRVHCGVKILITEFSLESQQSNRCKLFSEAVLVQTQQ